MTNYGRIMSMSLEEMAKKMPCPYDGVDGFEAMSCIEPKGCKDCCMDYLRAEVKEDDV